MFQFSTSDRQGKQRSNKKNNNIQYVLKFGLLNEILHFLCYYLFLI